MWKTATSKAAEIALPQIIDSWIYTLCYAETHVTFLFETALPFRNQPARHMLNRL